MRYMGGLRHRMPTTFIVYLIGSLALAGIVPLAGFWSKDEILLHDQTYALPIFIILAIAALGTAFYVARQLIMVFFGRPRHAAAEHAAESPRIMTTPLIVLAALTIFGGLLNLPLFPEASYKYAPFIAVLAIIGIIYGAVVSFAQKDVKKLVAYSSISHLGFVTLGIFSLNAAGIQGAILQLSLIHI